MTDGFNNNPGDDQAGWGSPENQTPPSGATPPSYTPPPSPYGQSAYPAQPKKRRLGLWITLAIVIPLLLCGLGVGGCVAFVVGQTKPAVDATNNFYKAAKEGKDLDKYTCQVYRDEGGDFTASMREVDNSTGPVTDYDFKHVSTDNGVATVTGEVDRGSHKFKNTKVQLVKEHGKYKVCRVDEL